MRAALEGGLNDPRRSTRLAALVAESVVVRHLLHAGCTVRLEVPTPTGRTCDVLAERDGVRLAIHVKRPRLVRRAGPIAIPSSLRDLESIARPWRVALDWRTDLDEEGLRELREAARVFIRETRPGDELVHRDADGRIAGHVRILEPHDDDRVTLVIGERRLRDQAVERIRKLLRKAYQQFMPGEENVIVIATSAPSDVDAIATALFGSLIERWDLFPRADRLVAHGRADDGFWSGGRYESSRTAAWIDADTIATVGPDARRLFEREGAAVDADRHALLSSLFGLDPERARARA